MAGGSKFRGIFDAVHEPEPGPEPRPAPASPISETHTSARASTGSTRQGDAAPPEETPAKRIGRPPVGKKSDPNYTQVTAYVRRDLYRDVRIALLQDGSGEDFSELVARLLEDWHRGRTAGNADG